MRWQASALISCILWIGACASYTDQTAQMRSSFRMQDYESSLQQLQNSEISETKRNRLLYHLEKAMILDRMNEKAKSRKLLSRASQIADELYIVSISKTAATFLVNESIQDYHGEDYEIVAIHTLSALSFLETGDYKAARVEAKKINNKLYTITKERDNSHNHYREDAFARFLSGLIYEALGDLDDAIIDFKKALDLYQSRKFKPFYVGSIPQPLTFGRRKIIEV